MGNLKTPIISPLRTQGGTFYTFASSIEDIGLNIAERKNKVRLSHYAVLDIPNTIEDDIDDETNKFNFYSCPGAMGRRFFNENENDNNANLLLNQNINTSIAQSFMSYALNMESAILNHKNYDYSTSLSVSERVFWKWLKESGAIRWYKNNEGILLEGDNKIDSKYINVVKAIGKIDAVSQRSSDYGIYNEVYVNIPSAFGTTEPIIFKQVEDNNYKFNSKYYSNTDNLIGYNENKIINGIHTIGFYDYSVVANDISTNYKINNENGIWSKKYASDIINDNTNIYLTDNNISNNETEYDVISVNISSDDSSIYPNYKFRRSKYDCMMLDILLNSQKYEDKTYDSLSCSDLSVDYQFNTILVYYSIYDNNDNILATNLYGVYFIDSPISADEAFKDKTMNFKLPRLNKRKSTGNGFGTSYSFRLNMRTSSIYNSENITIEDNSSSENSIINDFNNVVSVLNDSIKLLSKHTKYTHTISEKYNDIYYNIIELTNKLNETNNNVNRLLNNNENNINSNSIQTNKLTINDETLNVNSENNFNIVVNDKNIFEYDKSNNKINIQPAIEVTDLSKTLNINSGTDYNIDKIMKSNNIFDYITIVPKSSNNNNIFDLLDIEIKNNVDLNENNFSLKNNQIDIITLISYLLYKTRNI